MVKKWRFSFAAMRVAPRQSFIVALLYGGPARKQRPYSVGLFIDPRDASSCAALGHTDVTLWNECENLVSHAHKTVTWGGVQTITNQPAGCWYYYTTGQVDGISLRFNVAVSGQPAAFFELPTRTALDFLHWLRPAVVAARAAGAVSARAAAPSRSTRQERCARAAPTKPTTQTL